MNWVRGETVGHGSFGKVSLAVSGAGPPSMVVKSCGASSFGSLLNEKVVLDELQGCPEVVRCLGDGYSFENGERMYNVLLEFASLGALSENLKVSENRRFREREIRRYSRALLRGLKFIHGAGFVHCDIKLQNVLLCGDGRVKIADFGLARRAGERNNSGCELRGTPMYMSPEMVNGGEQGAPADVWALGCAVVEMASGAPAWKYSDVAGLFMRIGVGEEVPGFPGELSDQGRDFLEKCFIKDPIKRWTAEMLLNHPFVASDYHDGGATVALSEDSSSAPSPSPRCPFDFPDWVSEEESPLAPPSVTYLPSPVSKQSPAERLQGMFSYKFCRNWTADADGWVNVR